ncbi:YceD family protein [Derxia lacustris]|uniref:YceD family protein n=1 Tax=Derxia lacustris TaxID=764842 RepID=UPI000A16E77B|nr:YceD family protein [Derxia lacustris]
MADLTIPDIAAFGRAHETLSGSTAVADLPRVAEDASSPEPVEWRVEGEVITRTEAPEYADHIGLRLFVTAALDVPCARCLEPRRALIDIDSSFVVFDSEEAADAAPLDDDRFDPIVAQRSLDLRELLEDELLLAIDPAGTHDICSPEALRRLGLTPVGETVARIEDKPSAFDILRSLRSDGGEK